MVTEASQRLDPIELARRVVDALPLPVYCCSRAGKLLFANACARTLTPCTPELERTLSAAARTPGVDPCWRRVELVLGSVPVVLLVARGEPTSLACAAVRAAIAYDLTPGQLRALVLLADDPDLRRVACRLKLSVHTVKRHLEEIYAKTETRSLAGLIRKLVHFHP